MMYRLKSALFKLVCGIRSSFVITCRLLSVCTSLLDEQTLSDNQVLRNSIVHFLCLLTGYDRRSAPGEVTAPSFDIMTTKSGIEDVLNEDKFDPSQSADIQMVGFVLLPSLRTKLARFT